MDQKRFDKYQARITKSIMRSLKTGIAGDIAYSLKVFHENAFSFNFGNQPKEFKRLNNICVRINSFNNGLLI